MNESFLLSTTLLHSNDVNYFQIALVVHFQVSSNLFFPMCSQSVFYMYCIFKNNVLLYHLFNRILESQISECAAELFNAIELGWGLLLKGTSVVL